MPLETDEDQKIDGNKDVRRDHPYVISREIARRKHFLNMQDACPDQEYRPSQGGRKAKAPLTADREQSENAEGRIADAYFGLERIARLPPYLGGDFGSGDYMAECGEQAAEPNEDSECIQGQDRDGPCAIKRLPSGDQVNDACYDNDSNREDRHRYPSVDYQS